MGAYVIFIFMKLNYKNVMKKAMVANKALFITADNNNKMHVKVSQT